jgi:Ca-activated chloride channel family protein
MNCLKQLRSILFFWLLIAFVMPVYGQQKEIQQDQEPIKLKSILVQVPVVVSDKGGRYITDLTVKDFQLYEGGKEQEISFFGSIEEPFSVALLLDSSGSTGEQLETIKEAAIAFIDSLRPLDRVMVISFNDSVQIQCEMTGDRDLLKRAVRAIRSGEYTQVFEAVYTAVWEKLAKLKGRKAVILFTDGIDTASSEIVEEDTLDAVIESEDVIIYPIRYGTRRDVEKKVLLSGKYSSAQLQEKQEELNKAYKAADEYLYKLAEYSGGSLERADELGDLGKAFGKIANELRQQYVIGYYPNDLPESDNNRKIKIRVNKNGAKVRARPSYSLTQ